jgi:hypothetical protein
MSSHLEDSRRHLSWLRRQHNLAIEEFRYLDAAEIQSEIDKMTSNPFTYNWRRLASDRLSKIKLQYDKNKEGYFREKERILDAYRPRFQFLTFKQDEQLQTLAEERKQAINREIIRPIPEVDHLLMRSKVFAKDHQYQYASDVYREAFKKKDQIIRERIAACKATFRDQKRQMIERHTRELEVMDSGISACLEKLDLEYGANLQIIGHRHRINEFRNGVWPPTKYSLGNFHEQRDIAENFPAMTNVKEWKKRVEGGGLR